MRLGRDGFSLPTYLRPSRQRTNRFLELFSWIVLSVGVADEWLVGEGTRYTMVGAKIHPFARCILLASSWRWMHRELDVLIDMVPVSWLAQRP